MEIILKAYDEKVKITTEKEDLTIDEMLGYFERLLYAAGYHFKGEVGIIEDE